MVICRKTGITSNRKMEEVSENNGFVENDEDDEVDIDDDFEDIEEEDFDENNVCEISDP